MKRQLIDMWLRPVVEHPRSTVAGLAAVAALFLPHYSAQIATAAAALGLMFSADAGKQ